MTLKNNDKWKRINILSELISQIEPFVDAGKFNSVPSFIDVAIREKLAKEEA